MPSIFDCLPEPMASAFKVTKQLLMLQPSFLCSRQQEGEEDGKAIEQVSHLSQFPPGAEHPTEHYLNLTGQHLVTRPYLIVWEAGKCSLILYQSTLPPQIRLGFFTPSGGSGYQVGHQQLAGTKDVASQVSQGKDSVLS